MSIKHDEIDGIKGANQNESEVPLNKDISRIEEANEEQQLNQNEEDGITKENRRQKKNVSKSTKIKKYLILAGLCLLILVLLIFLILTYTTAPENDDQSIKIAGIASPKQVTVPDAQVPQGPSSSTLHVFANAAICSDHSLCSNIGKEIFHRGGNVVDSAVATLLCNGITTLQSSGIGGGFLMNVYIKEDNIAYTIDAREVAPLQARENMFDDLPKQASFLGPLAIAVPGEVMGYETALNRFGSMTLKELIEPSIKICENGFPLSRHMWDSLELNKKAILNDEHLSEMLVDKDTNEFHKMGAHVHPPKELCQTYRLLAKNGAKDFYDGELAEMIIEDLKEVGSILSANDLRVYQADLIHSISVRLNDDTMYVVPPVGSGVIVANMLNILKGYNWTNENETDLNFHRMVEAFKFGFAKRYELGDLRFNRDLGELISNLTSSSYGDYIRQKIDDDATFDDYQHYGAKFYTKMNNGTSHMSLIAPNGDAVGVTSTINFYFGSGISGNRTGIIFNGAMEDYSKPGQSNMFDIPSSKPNFIQPRKRAMSSMSPTIITDDNGDVKLIIGAAGGGKITTSITQIIARVLFMGQDIKEAVDAPRIHHQLIPNVLEYEYGVLQDVLDGLEDRGHKIKRCRNRGSVACGIFKNSTAIYANADYRKEGDVAGL